MDTMRVSCQEGEPVPSGDPNPERERADVLTPSDDLATTSARSRSGFGCARATMLTTTMPRERGEILRDLWPFVGCGAVIELCWLGVLGLGDLRHHLVAFVGFFVIAFVAYLGAAWLTLARHARVPLALILVAAALFRVTLLFA